jgi:hypothetical protein
MIRPSRRDNSSSRKVGALVHRGATRAQPRPRGDVHNLGAERAAAIHTRGALDRSYQPGPMRLKS